MHNYDTHAQMGTTCFYQGLGVLQLWSQVQAPSRRHRITLHWTSTYGLSIKEHDDS